jgi:hypothetical protein
VLFRSEARRCVLANEARVTGLFEEIIRRGAADGSLAVAPTAGPLLADDITVLGHMWTFRRWRLAGRYDLEEYTRQQTELVLARLTNSSKET